MTPQNHSARRVILILGMHRSGTSALGRVLNLLGAQAPAHLMPPAPDNPRGFWESISVSRLNDQIFSSADSSWNDWSRLKEDRLLPTTIVAFQSRMKAVLQAEFEDADFFVLKDPRLSRLLPLWQPVLAELDITPSVLIALRHPLAVAHSLATRNGFPLEHSLLIWLRYMLDAERHTRTVPRDFVSYDALLEDWRGISIRISERLKFDWPVSSKVAGLSIDSFLDPDLRHHQAADAVIPSVYARAWTQHTWTALRALEQSNEDPNALATLDRVRGQFEDACRLFSSALPALSSSRRSFGRADLQAVTLCAADSHYVPLTTRALKESVRYCNFADAILFSNATVDGPFRCVAAPELSSREDYSAFVLRRLTEHITTSHMLLIQWDGYVVEPEAWDPSFLAYDYIGAIWGRFRDGMDVGNGGFSLRSRRLLDALQDPRFKLPPHLPEDEAICRLWRPALERDYDIQFAPPAVANRFAHERVLPKHRSFGFHGLFNFWRHLDDGEISEVVTLLPESCLRGREFAELIALCFLNHRDVALRVLSLRWTATWPISSLITTLRPIFRDEALLQECLGRLKFL